MQPLIMTERAAFDDAVDLVDRLGAHASDEAAARADRSRGTGNVIHFCRWRQVERLILLLALEEAVGTVH